MFVVPNFLIGHTECPVFRTISSIPQQLNHHHRFTNWWISPAHPAGGFTQCRQTLADPVRQSIGKNSSVNQSPKMTTNFIALQSVDGWRVTPQICLIKDIIMHKVRCGSTPVADNIERHRIEDLLHKLRHVKVSAGRSIFLENETPGINSRSQVVQIGWLDPFRGTAIRQRLKSTRASDGVAENHRNQYRLARYTSCYGFRYFKNSEKKKNKKTPNPLNRGTTVTNPCRLYELSVQNVEGEVELSNNFSPILGRTSAPASVKISAALANSQPLGPSLIPLDPPLVLILMRKF